METLLFYRPDSEHARAVTEFLHDFEHTTGKTIETVDVDSKEGMVLLDTYNIMDYPAIIARKSDGAEITRWVGLPLPTISEVSYYVKNNDSKLINHKK